MATATGILKVTTTTWTIKNEDQEVITTGDFPEAIVIDDEDFDFDGVTARVASLSGVNIENNQLYTEANHSSAFWTINL